MSLGGRNPDLLVSPTDEMGKIMGAIHALKQVGKLSFVDGVQVAYLALKHRRNKNGGQRIVVFVGSPVHDTSEQLTRTGKVLKKNNVSSPGGQCSGPESVATRVSLRQQHFS